ncbi:hypothetical protein HBI62_130990 [Parastagonospora nodorum]|nr:hypothetical protein HBH97_020510 [Parastagonospora nodorum]KAH4971674.1 hypothetical protein HBI78_035680 [Parastagonospora nodorum]KAH5221537.1 hypothetical protein HBI62_130990 [Parastagonospora nodorum]KAH6312535.1 hypothetical protein HBI39_058040 [Parastagonospora nodorum]KAH6459221.1 hypothetical protein HBI57_100260 [Parastagonospora nodorum]
MRNNIFSNPASAAIFFAKFSRLDPATRRNVFRLLADDLYTAVDLAVDQPQYAHEVGSVLFRSYRATSPRQLFVFLVALTAVRDFSPHVQTIILSSPFDDPGQSGFYEWLYEFAGWTLPAGHLGLPVQHIGWNLVDLWDAHVPAQLAAHESAAARTARAVPERGETGVADSLGSYDGA